jgi:ATP-dependent exoDNAse (exonuclease V) alpha subunit
MITRNIYSQQIFNGMQGTVIRTSRDPNEVAVRLDAGRAVTVRPEVFTIRNKWTGGTLASRKQLPLRLSYAVTGEFYLSSNNYPVHR